MVEEERVEERKIRRGRYPLADRHIPVYTDTIVPLDNEKVRSRHTSFSDECANSNTFSQPTNATPS